jgi:hypothetical protein
MLAGLDYVEWAGSQVLLQRHKNAREPGCRSSGIFLNYFMFLTSGGGVTRPLGVQ